MLSEVLAPKQIKEDTESLQIWGKEWNIPTAEQRKLDRRAARLATEVRIHILRTLR